ncbi:MAG: hypothetical protein KAI47_18315, partial [Deltaproteobacteria bacterium]|nr:hypothetical protein [Deltaproteobacteria bacterium]
ALLEIDRLPQDKKPQGLYSSGTTPPRASDPRMGRLRKFCQRSGIEIPYRRFSMIAQKTDGMAEALEAAGIGRAARTLILISDLLDIDSPETILRPLALAKRKHHHVIVIQPADSPGQGRLTRHEERVHAIVALRQERERRTLRHAIRARGIPIFDANTPGHLPKRRVRP